MKNVLGRAYLVLIGLTLLVLMLVGILVWEWDVSVHTEQELMKMRVIPVTAVPMQTILPEFSLPDATTGFPELLARPIFASNRKPAVTAKDGAAAMKKGQFALVGVLITPQKRSGLLRDVQSNKTETIALGSVIRGLTLGDVEPTRVVLRQGAESEELVLNVRTGPKSPGGIPISTLTVPVVVAPPPIPAPLVSAPTRQSGAISAASAPLAAAKSGAASQTAPAK